MERRRKLSARLLIAKTRLRNRRGFNPDEAREQERQELLKERDIIRGSLRLDRYLTSGLTFGGIGSIIAGVALVAADMKEAGLALVAAGGLAQLGSIGRTAWSTSQGYQVEDLDRVQETLHRRHHIFPDEGYFKRAYEDSARRIRAENRMKAGEDAYEKNIFGSKSLKPPYRY